MRKITIFAVLGVCFFILMQACGSTEGQDNSNPPNEQSINSSVNEGKLNDQSDQLSENTSAIDDSKAEENTDNTPALSSSEQTTVDDKSINEEQPNSKFDTSVFAYAESIDVKDQRDSNQHIDLAIHMNSELSPGLATEHVIIQSYDYLQQSDIKGADTITIGILQGDTRVCQITVDTKKFKAGEKLIDSVLNASKIDSMNDDVKEYGKVMERW